MIEQGGLAEPSQPKFSEVDTNRPRPVLSKPFAVILTAAACLFVLFMFLTRRAPAMEGLILTSERPIKANDFKPWRAASDLGTWYGFSWDGPALLDADDAWIKFENRKKMPGPPEMVVLPGDKLVVTIDKNGLLYLLATTPKPVVLHSSRLKMADRKVGLAPLCVAAFKDGFYAMTFDGFLEEWSATQEGLRLISNVRFSPESQHMTGSVNGNGQSAWIETQDSAHVICFQRVPQAKAVKIRPPHNDEVGQVTVTENGELLYSNLQATWLWHGHRWMEVARFNESLPILLESRANLAAIWQLDDLIVIDATTGARLAHLKAHYAHPVQFSADATEMSVVTIDNVIRRYRLTELPAR